MSAVTVEHLHGASGAPYELSILALVVGIMGLAGAGDATYVEGASIKMT
jgi:hypothetical protein